MFNKLPYICKKRQEDNYSVNKKTSNVTLASLSNLYDEIVMT